MDLIDHGCFWGTNGVPVDLPSLVDLGDTNAINYNNNYPARDGIDGFDSYTNNSYPNALNDNGLAVGYSDTLVSSLQTFNGQVYNVISQGPSRACYWQPSISTNPQYLPPLAGVDPTQSESYAYGVNKSGLIAGSSTFKIQNGSLNDHACVWHFVGSQATAEDIDAQDSNTSEATCINDVGQVAGTVSGRPCIWTNSNGTTWTRDNLDPSSKYYGYHLTKINNNGEIIGTREKGNIFHPTIEQFYWSPTTRVMKDPNNLIAGLQSGWSLYNIEDISDSGYITGRGYNSPQNAGIDYNALLLRPVIWGARISLTGTSTGTLAGRTVKDHLVSLNNGNVTLLSGLSFDSNGNVVADLTAQIPVSSIASIQVLNDHPDSTNSADIPDQQGFNKYNRLGQRTIELRPGQTSSSGITGCCYTSEGGWSITYYTYPIGGPYMQQNPMPMSSAAIGSLYAIPRVPGTVDYNQVHEALKDAATSLELGVVQLVKQRQVPRQILYAIAWQESLDAFDSANPSANGRGWNQFGWVTRYSATTSSHSTYDHDSNYGSINYTMVTIDGGIGIMQLTGDTALNLAQVVPSSTSDDLAKNLTVLYGLSSNPMFNIQAGAWVLDGKWPGTAPYAQDAAMQFPVNFLDHWYTAVGAYNKGGLSYIQQVWNWIRTANTAYQSVVTNDVSDPGLNPVPYTFKTTYDNNDNPIQTTIVTPNALFGDFDLDGQIDLQISSFTRGASSNGQTPISVQLAPRSGFVVTQVTATAMLEGTNRATVSLTNNGGIWTGNIPATLSSGLKFYFLLDITGNGLTKRAVVSR